MSPRGRLVWLFLATVCCSRTSRQFPMGPDLSRLPRQGDASLSSMVPGPAWALVAMRDPLQEFERWRASPSGKDSRLLADLPLLPWIQRWQTLRNRLAEEIRRPLPDLQSLLDGPIVLGVLPGDAERPVSFILVERLGAEAQPALELARALNAVHPAGQDVEVERYLGIPLRKVRVGAAQWICYFVLADRLAIGSDLGVLKRSLKRALAGEGASAGDQPLLKKAETTGMGGGLGAAFDGQLRVGAPGGSRRAGSREALLGIRSLSLAGPDLTGDLDKSLWGSGKIELEISAAAGLVFRAPGLDLQALWQATRPKALASPSEMTLVDDLDGLTASLARGLVVSLGWNAPSEVGLSVTLPVQSRESSRAALARLLRDSLASGEIVEEERSAVGFVTCPRKRGEEPAFCCALTADRLILGTSRAALFGGSPKSSPPADLKLIAELSGEAGGYTGHWSLGSLGR